MADSSEAPGSPGGHGEAGSAAALGARIRERRRARELTMMQLADLAGLSQPFISQLERGLARPSMSSLHRIARSLGTTTPVLMSGRPPGSGGTEPVGIVRAGGGTTVQHDGGTTRALAERPGALLPLEFRVTERAFPEYFAHPADEFLYVVSGRIEVDLGDHGCHELAVGDSLAYGGEVPHRFRLLGRTAATVLVVQAAADDVP